jgi:MoaA/NifB/PqqE/SkfB family radical SAM enzyme
VDDPRPPVRVEVQAGRGLQVRLLAADGDWLHLSFTPAESSPAAYHRTDTTALCHLGHRTPAEDQGRWLQAVLDALPEVEAVAGWQAFLRWAEARPAVALTGVTEESDRPVSSGDDLLVRVTGRCNARCAFCSARGWLPDLVKGRSALTARLTDGRARGFQRVTFTGGEPTLVPWLAEAVREARQAGYTDVCLQTNGWSLAREAARRKLLDAGLSSLFVSLHSARPEVHDAMLGRRGMHARLLEACIALYAEGLAIGFNCVLTRQNLAGLEELVDLLAARFGGPRVHLCLSFCSPQGWAREHLELMPDLAEAAAAMETGLRAGSERGLDVRIPGVCGVPMCVLPGRLRHFDEFRAQSPPELPEREFLAGCQDCSLRQRCSGFWRLYFEERGEQGIAPVGDWS